MEHLSRRKALLGAASLAVAAAAPAVTAAPANVPVIWDGKKMWESFEKDATGFAFPCKREAARPMWRLIRSVRTASDFMTG